jgi:hypothetical protein
MAPSNTVNALGLFTYRHWDATAHTGSNPSPAYANTTASIWSHESSSFNYYLYGDLDAIYIITQDGSTYNFSAFGILTSAWVASFATTANAESAGADVVIEVDDTSMFTEGQYYSILNSNNASGQCEKILISDIDPGVSITATLANDHPAGAVIGEDPRPNYVCSYSGTVNMAGLTAAVGTVGNVVLTTPYSLVSIPTISTATDPEARQGYTWLFPLFVYNTTTAIQEFRGTLKEVYWTGGSNVVSTDTITVGSTVYKFFAAATPTDIAIKQG